MKATASMMRPDSTDPRSVSNCQRNQALACWALFSQLCVGSLPQSFNTLCGWPCEHLRFTDKETEARRDSYLARVTRRVSGAGSGPRLLTSWHEDRVSRPRLVIVLPASQDFVPHAGRGRARPFYSLQFFPSPLRTPNPQTHISNRLSEHL